MTLWKIFNLRSKWLTVLLICLLSAVVLLIGYLKFYNIDSQHDHLDQLYTENGSLKTQLLKLENGYRLLNNSVSTLQTQMTHGVILDSLPKGKLQVKSSVTQPVHVHNSSKSEKTSHVQNSTQRKDPPKRTPSVEQISQKELYAEVDALIDNDIEHMLNESNHFMGNTFRDRQTVSSMSIEDQHMNNIECDQNQVVVVEDGEDVCESASTVQYKENKFGIIRSNNFEIESSVLDLNNFHQDMTNNYQLTHHEEVNEETDDDEYEGISIDEDIGKDEDANENILTEHPELFQEQKNTELSQEQQIPQQKNLEPSREQQSNVVNQLPVGQGEIIAKHDHTSFSTTDTRVHPNLLFGEQKKKITLNLRKN